MEKELIVEPKFSSAVDVHKVTAEELKEAIIHVCTTYSLDELATIFKVDRWDKNFTDSLSWGVNTLRNYSLEEIIQFIKDYEACASVIPGDFAYFKDDFDITHRGMVITSMHQGLEGESYIEIFDGREVFSHVLTKNIIKITGHSADFDMWLKDETLPV